VTIRDRFGLTGLPCRKLIEAIPSRMYDEKRPGDVLKVPGDPLDDVADDARYGIYTFITSTEKPRHLAVRDEMRAFDEVFRRSGKVLPLNIEAGDATTGAQSKTTNTENTPEMSSIPNLDERTKQSLKDYEAEVERLAREFEEEATRLALELAESMPIEQDDDHYTEAEYELDIEFGRLEAARDQYFSLLDKTDKEVSKCPPFEYLVDDLVDGLLPMNEVHVIAGETGAGKSTWLFDNFISPWQHEAPMLGCKSHWYAAP